MTADRRQSIIVFDGMITHIHQGAIPRQVATVAGALTDLGWSLGVARESGDDSVTLAYAVDPTGAGPDAVRKEIIASGYTVAGDAAHDTAWWVARRGRRTVQVVVREWAGGDPLVGPLRPAARVAADLWEWYNLTGTPYAYGPGTATVINIRSDRRINPPRWVLKDEATTEPWRPPAQIQDIRWHPRLPKRGMECHRWDMRAAYLAAAAQVALPLGQLGHTGVDPQAGIGYYRVHVASWTGVDVFDMIGRRDRQGCVWVTNAMLDLLRDRYSLEVVDSYTEQRGGRLLRHWAERWRDALVELGPIGPSAVRQALKAGYTQAIGLFNVARGTIYRPDWRHLIIDQARASLLRRILRVHELTGLVPARVDVDSVWYATEAIKAGGWRLDNLHHALGVADNIGRMRYEGIEVIQ